jgi:hypothetical protein
MANAKKNTFKLEFDAEIKEVSAKRLASLDTEYRLILLTPDPSVLNLGALDNESLLRVTVEIAE